MRTLNIAPLDEIDATIAFNSQAIDVLWMSEISVQTIATGPTLMGAIQIQASNDISTPVNWSTLTTVNINGTATTMGVYNYTFKWLRFSYAPASGAGVVSVKIVAQGQS